MKFLANPCWSGLLGCGAALFASIFPAISRAEGDFEWKTVLIGGRDYLSAEQISRFYDLKLSRPDGNKVVLDDGKKVQMSMEVDSSVCVINGIRFVFDTPVVKAESSAQIARTDLSRILDPVLRPEFIRTNGPLRTVILDPAYGGEDRGSTSERGSAADATLRIALLVAKEMERPHNGYEVVLTRDADVSMTPEKRLELANAVEGGAVFIRIHFGNGEGDKRGTATAPLSVRNQTPGDDEMVKGNLGSASVALASAVHGSAFQILKPHMVDLGIQPTFDPVFSKLKHPAIFLDVGCLSDPEDAKLIHNEAYQTSLAKAIAQGLRKYRKATEK
jgi:N-acetylmuramoyl-L-alanine amidase